VYAFLTNPLLLIALGFLVGGFAAINRFGTCARHRAGGTRADARSA
jgi:hypothetical protein